MTLHPEDIRYWFVWVILGVLAFVATRLWLVNPIIRAIEKGK